MADDSIEKLLDGFREITETESVEHVWKDGRYQGARVVYKNPLHPDLKEVFHPYVPLIITGDEPQPTREWFIENGFSVPGEPPAARH